MKLKVNGITKTFQSPITIGELVESEGFLAKRIAIELNGEIKSYRTCETTILSDGDQIEIVSFVGGG